jgi:hypothetical protein
LLDHANIFRMMRAVVAPSSGRRVDWPTSVHWGRGSGVHYALITNGAAVSDPVRAAALRELTAWAGAKFQ